MLKRTTVLFDCDRIDDCLNAARNARGAEREQKFPGLILNQLFGIHVLKYVNAI